VSVDVPVLFATEIVPREQVVAGFMAGETLQVRVTVDGLSPPDEVIVIVDFAEAPGATEDGDSAVAERLKSGAVTTRFITVELLALKLLSPPYAAVMLCVPAVSAEVENVAIPLPFRSELPIWFVPSRKLTVPVGVPPAVVVTVIAKVTVWCRFAEVGAKLNAVAVFAFCTTWLTAGDVLGSESVSPL
jgi:hypothetical protein